LRAFAHPFRHIHALCIDAAFTGDAYKGENPFGSPARKGWDEASARRFTPYPALCGASRCSVFVTALYEIEGILSQRILPVKPETVFFPVFALLPREKRAIIPAISIPQGGERKEVLS